MKSLGEIPIIQAPMAGGPSTHELVRAVSEAGGTGFVAAGYLSAAGLVEAISAVRDLTDSAFGVNIFMAAGPADPELVSSYAARIQEEAQRLGVELGEAAWEDDDYEAKLELLLSSPVAIVSFTFGCPASIDIEALQRRGKKVAVTVTSVEEAQFAEGRGADLLVVQGTEAGGHQGSFLDLDENHRPLIQLLREIKESSGLEMIGAGGVMDHAGFNEVMEAGAAAVQVGTALLCAPEAGTADAYRGALVDLRYEETIVTRAYSGRFGRGLSNRFAIQYGPFAPQAYPEVHHLTRPLRAAAMNAGDTSVPNLWAGTGWRKIRVESAAKTIRRIATGSA